MVAGAVRRLWKAPPRGEGQRVPGLFERDVSDLVEARLEDDGTLVLDFDRRLRELQPSFTRSGHHVSIDMTVFQFRWVEQTFKQLEGDRDSCARWTAIGEACPSSTRHGNGTDTAGVGRGNVWYLNHDFDGDHDIPALSFGRDADILVAGLWPGGGVGRDNPAVVPVSDGSVDWYLRSSNHKTDYTVGQVTFGGAFDRPLPGDWHPGWKTGDGVDAVGVARLF